MQKSGGERGGEREDYRENPGYQPDYKLLYIHSFNGGFNELMAVQGYPLVPIITTQFKVHGCSRYIAQVYSLSAMYAKEKVNLPASWLPSCGYSTAR
jgi:hypothetical protein